MEKPLVFVFLAALAAASCEPPVDDVVTLYFHPHPYMSKEAMLDGCRLWRHKGVMCTEVERAQDADVVVAYDKETPCGRWYGNGGPGGINLHPQCFLNTDGTVDMHKLEIVFAHEAGHAFGVDHLPSTCDAAGFAAEAKDVDASLTIRYHPESGKPVCGPGVMNPAPQISLIEPTEVDDMAFDLRYRKGASVSVPCTLPTGKEE